MSYSISGSGHGVDLDKVHKAFTDLVEALDEATDESGTKFQGSLSGSENEQSFSLTADKVRSGGETAST